MSASGQSSSAGKRGGRLSFSAQDWAAVGIPGMQEPTPRRGEGNGTEHGTDNSSPQVAIASVRSLQELFRPRGIQIKVFWSLSSSSWFEVELRKQWEWPLHPCWLLPLVLCMSRKRKLSVLSA